MMLRFEMLCVCWTTLVLGQRHIQRTQRKVVDVGGTVTLYCKRESTAVNWRKDSGAFITLHETLLPPYQDQMKLNKRGNNVDLVIMNFGKKHAGLYQCIDSSRQILYAYQVLITEEARISNYTKDLTVRENTVVNLWCNASGQPEPEILWYIVTENNEVPIGIEGSKLQIRDITRQCGATYRCSATNKRTQQQVTRDIKVSVEFPPHIFGIEIIEGTVCPDGEEIPEEISDEEELTWSLGETISLVCHWSASPMDAVEWYKVDENGDTKIGVLRSNKESNDNLEYDIKTCITTTDVHALKLSFKLTSESQFTEYKCVVYNKYNTSEFSVDVKKRD